MMEKIKENGVFIGVIAFVLFIIAFIFMSSTEPRHIKTEKVNEVSESENKEPSLAAGTFIGTIPRVDGKSASLSYSFSLPEGVKTEVSDDGAFIIATKGDKTFFKMYISDERDRKQDEKTYLQNIIAPQVKGFAMLNTVTLGDYSWQKAESATMEWRVAKVEGGEWLVMTENYKSDSGDIEKLIGSLKVGYKNNVTVVENSAVETSVKSESAEVK